MIFKFCVLVSGKKKQWVLTGTGKLVRENSCSRGQRKSSNLDLLSLKDFKMEESLVFDTTGQALGGLGIKLLKTLCS